MYHNANSIKGKSRYLIPILVRDPKAKFELIVSFEYETVVVKVDDIQTSYFWLQTNEKPTSIYFHEIHHPGAHTYKTLYPDTIHNYNLYRLVCSLFWAHEGKLGHTLYP